MIELNNCKLYNDDCLDRMEILVKENIKVDAIICDPPYGTIKDLCTDGWKNTNVSWDEKIDTCKMFSLCEQLLRQNGILILFSQEPYTSELRTYRTSNIKFAYPLIWIKNHFCNYLICKKAPVSYFEDISIFYKKYDSECSNPIREYFKNVLQYIGITKSEIMKKLGHQKADHVFRIDTMQFMLCSKEVYEELTEKFNLTLMNNYKTYQELKEVDSKYNIRTFNLCNNQKYKSNILKYDKENTSFHPTQKPLNLLKDLIETYTNKTDTILDFTMGSGMTGVASINLGRKFIGIELDKEYFDIAAKRIENETKQMTLF